MWTPRRLLLLVVGASLCTATFVVYNRFLGWIDGLPALPERYLAVAKGDQPVAEVNREDRIRRLLRLSFGDNCAELSYRYQLSVQAQGIILAMEEFDIVDGRVILRPFSMAVVGKPNPNTNFPEINTVHCDVATITFDHRIETYADIGRSKMTAAEFRCDPAMPSSDPRHDGNIYVVHNHGTPQTDDDLHAKSPGPVYFEDNALQHPERPQLWTTRSVEITDYQTRPPHTITAQTFGVFLEADALKSDERIAKAKDHSSPIRKVELGNVHMILTVPPSSDFLASPGETTQRPANESPRPILTIRTLGAFTFDVRTNRAAFTVPATKDGLRRYVEVTRGQPAGSDELQCDRLDLQFRRRAAATAPPATSADPAGPGNLEIEQAWATGNNVVLTSTAEKLHARGTSLVFNNDRREAVLRGSPMMSAIKDGNRIEAPQLLLHRPDPTKPIPALVTLGRAPGPGTVFMHDEKGQRSVQARWQGELVIERDRARDRITLAGGAVFDDQENQQWLEGDEIKIWMSPSPPATSAAAPDPSPQPEPPRARPERMRVAGHVKARSPDLRIDHTPVLVVWFREGPAGTTTGGAIVRTAGASPAAVSTKPAVGGNAGPAPPAELPPPKKPIELSAEYVEASVLRSAEHSELQQVNCRGRVHVHQESTAPKERPLDVTAHALELVHTPFGDVLQLAGLEREPARFEARDMTLFGPQVLVDQRDNRAEVNGPGVLVLVTATNLNGERLEQPSEVTIQWTSRMDVVGNRISFRGGVEAEQETVRVRDFQTEKELNRMLSPRMDVYLDRPVSFNRVQRAPSMGAAAPQDDPRIKRVVCHRGEEGGRVTAAGNMWRNGRRVRYQEIIAPEVTYENDAREVSAAGPGVMRLFQLDDGYASDPAEKRASSPTEPVFKLTRVAYEERMRANNNTQTAEFIGQIRVYQAPTNDPTLEIDPDKLPPGAFTLTCKTLEVASRSEGGRRWATMIADGKADIYAPDFSGRADVIKYDESKKQQVIFESRNGGNPAVLYHFKVKGEPPMELLGDSIIYWRKDNTFKLNGGRGATGAK